MKNPFSNAKPFIAQLQHIETKIQQNQLKEAADALNVLGKITPHDPRLFLLGGRLAEASGNLEGLLAAARKAHQLAPQWPVAIIYLAEVLASRNEAPEAFAVAGQAIQQAKEQGALNVELLKKAAAVAIRVDQPSTALEWFQQAHLLQPDDQSIQHHIARLLTSQGEHTSAIAMFTALLTLQPANPLLLLDRLRTYLSAQQTDQAAIDGEALVAMDPQNETYRFFLAIAKGETPPRQPGTLVAALFDSYAGRYDHNYITLFNYKLPRQVADTIIQWHPDRKCDVLDLGCGTGLLGACLGRTEGVLVGVDLSVKMIELAYRHQVYDSFHQVNLLDALRDTPDELYGVIAALDVFIYVGDLTPVVANAHRILIPTGRFVFSCEYGPQEGAQYALQSTYRYTHQHSYVQRLLEEAGFKDIDIEDRVLRYEADQPVQGFLVTARKQPPAVKDAVRRSTKKTVPASLPE